MPSYLTPFKPKAIRSIEQRYHLMELSKALSLPAGRLQKHILRWHLNALNIEIVGLKHEQLIDAAISRLTTYGLKIPETINIPQMEAEAHDPGWFPEPPKPKKVKRAPTPEETAKKIESQIERLQKKLESTLLDNSQKNQ